MWYPREVINQGSPLLWQIVHGRWYLGAKVTAFSYISDARRAQGSWRRNCQPRCIGRVAASGALGVILGSAQRSFPFFATPLFAATPFRVAPAPFPKPFRPVLFLSIPFSFRRALGAPSLPFFFSEAPAKRARVL